MLMIITSQISNQFGHIIYQNDPLSKGETRLSFICHCSAVKSSAGLVLIILKVGYRKQYYVYRDLDSNFPKRII